MDLKNSLYLVLLAAIWGASFMFMKMSVTEFGPLALMFARTAIACLFLLPLVLLKKRLVIMQRHWRRLFIVGFFNTALPFCLFAYATLTLTAGLTSILNATAPMFGALIGFIWLNDRLSLRAISGLIIGFSGVLLLVIARDVPLSFDNLKPVFAILVATSCYGLAANYTKQYFTGVDSLVMATGSQLTATAMLLPLALIYWPEINPGQTAWLSATVLGLVCTGLAYILFFKLISAVGPTKAISVTYLIPVFGVLWGAWLLKETIALETLAGGAVILIGVALATEMRFLRANKQG